MQESEFRLGKSNERLAAAEQYRMLPYGGRVKAAGASFGMLYDAAALLIVDPTGVEAAFETSKRFARLKDQPPFQLRVAYFPQDEIAMKTAFKGSGIYRPTIKTDQGPAGNVGYFSINQHGPSQLSGRLVREQGVAVVESFLNQRLNGKFSKDEHLQISQAINDVQQHYQKGNYKGAYEGITTLRSIGNARGVETTRRVGVGRGEFFFFRPVQTDMPMVVGGDLAEAIAQKTQEVVNRVERLATITKNNVRNGTSLREAMLKAYQLEQYFDFTDSNAQLYFQPDVLIRSDGSFDIERINMPDLGMFLTGIQVSGANETLGVIKGINEKIKEDVLDVIAQATGQQVVLLTRDEVVQDSEDTLEQLELAVVGEGLVRQGKQVSIAALGNIDAIASGSSILLFNVSTQAPGYEQLLRRVAEGDLQCYPDPFVKLFEKEATTFQRHVVDEKVLNKFLQIIAPCALDKPEGVCDKFLTIQKALRLGGIDSDIVYFNVSENDGRYIPTFRYDVKSFFEVYKAAEVVKRRGEKVVLTAIPVPFAPQDAVLQGKDGPRLSLFRFMFVRR